MASVVPSSLSLANDISITMSGLTLAAQTVASRTLAQDRERLGDVAGWDDHVVVQRYSQHTDAVSSVVCSDSWLFSASLDGTVCLMDLKYGELCETVEIASSWGVRTIAQHEQIVMAGCSSGIVAAIDFRVGSVVQRLKGHVQKGHQGILSSNFDDGQRYGPGYEIEDGGVTVVQHIPQMADTVGSFGQWLTAGSDGIIKFWDLRKHSKPISAFRMHEGPVNSVKLFNSGRCWSAGMDCSLKSWCMESANDKSWLQLHDEDISMAGKSANNKNPNAIFDINFSRATPMCITEWSPESSNSVVVSYSDGSVRGWDIDLENARNIRVLELKKAAEAASKAKGAETSASSTSKGKKEASGKGGKKGGKKKGKGKKGSTEDTGPVDDGTQAVPGDAVWLVHRSCVRCIAPMNVRGTTMLVSGSDDGYVMALSKHAKLAGQVRAKPAFVFRGHTDGINCVAATGDLLASAGQDHSIRIFDLSLLADCEAVKAKNLDLQKAKLAFEREKAAAEKAKSKKKGKGKKSGKKGKEKDEPAAEEEPVDMTRFDPLPMPVYNCVFHPGLPMPGLPAHLQGEDFKKKNQSGIQPTLKYFPRPTRRSSNLWVILPLGLELREYVPSQEDIENSDDERPLKSPDGHPWAQIADVLPGFPVSMESVNVGDILMSVSGPFTEIKAYGTLDCMKILADTLSSASIQEISIARRAPSDKIKAVTTISIPIQSVLNRHVTSNPFSFNSTDVALSLCHLIPAQSQRRSIQIAGDSLLHSSSVDSAHSQTPTLLSRDGSGASGVSGASMLDSRRSLLDSSRTDVSNPMEALSQGVSGFTALPLSKTFSSIHSSLIKHSAALQMVFSHFQKWPSWMPKNANKLTSDLLQGQSNSELSDEAGDSEDPDDDSPDAYERLIKANGGKILALEALCHMFRQMGLPPPDCKMIDLVSLFHMPFIPGLTDSVDIDVIGDLFEPWKLITPMTFQAGLVRTAVRLFGPTTPDAAAAFNFLLDEYFLPLANGLALRNKLDDQQTINTVVGHTSIAPVIADHFKQLWNCMKHFTLGSPPASLISPRQFATMMEEAEVTRWSWERAVQAVCPSTLNSAASAASQPTLASGTASQHSMDGEYQSIGGDGQTRMVFSEFLACLIQVSQDFVPPELMSKSAPAAADVDITNSGSPSKNQDIDTTIVSFKLPGAIQPLVLRQKPAMRLKSFLTTVLLPKVDAATEAAARLQERVTSAREKHETI